MSIEMLKELSYKHIDNFQDDVERVAEDIYSSPETGFREVKTTEKVKKEFDKLGLKYRTFEGITGLKATLDTGRTGPSIAIISELDAVICAQHKDSDDSGAVHACGHNIMVADMLAVAKAMMDKNILDNLVGKIHFLAVPAEEYLEMEYRSKLIEENTIKYPTGKAELLHRGAFDDIDMCIMIHAMPDDTKICLESGSNGFIAKKVRYIGKSAHAASSPHTGVNALYAANLGLMAVNSIRETFREESCIRVHPVISSGCGAVNVIPSLVEIETFIRGNNVADINDANEKVDRAFIGAAVSMGAKVEIEDTPGMLPLLIDEKLISVAKKVGEELLDKSDVKRLAPSKGSTDLGDVSSLMPAIEICIGCLSGGLHSPDYQLSDKKTAYQVAPKLMSGMLIDLLSSYGKTAYEIIDNYDAVFKSKEEYFEYADKLFGKNTYPKIDYMEK